MMRQMTTDPARATTPRRPRLWRGMLALALVLACLAAAYLSFAVWSYIRNLDTAQQDHAEWVLSQLEVEYLKLDRALDHAIDLAPAATAAAAAGTTAGTGTGPDAAALEELRKRFDILYSRVQVIQAQSHGADHDPAVRRILTVLRGELDALIPLIDSSDSALRQGLGVLTRALARIGDLPREVALASIATAAETMERERHRVAGLLEGMIAVVLLVLLALLVTVIRLFRQTVALDAASQVAEESRLRLDTTLRGSLDAVVVTDDRARILDFNGSAESVFGHLREDALGRDFIDLLIPAPRRAELRGMLNHFHSTRETTWADKGRREAWMLHRDGRVFPVEMSVSLARIKSGPVFVSYIRDITDKKEKEAEIIRTRDEALAAYREKSRFFAMMSHEMRTPMNGVLSALQLLADSPLDAEQRGFVAAASTSGDILLGHINDVLAIERAEAGEGRGEDSLQPCDPAALARTMIATMEPLAQVSGARLHLQRDGLAGLDGRWVRSDPRALQQILVNLLSNAIKFAPGGDVTLEAGFHDSTAQTGVAQSGTTQTGVAPARPLLRLEVRDTGVGIPEAEQARIFEDFVSLDSRYERRTGGTGLGLGIVRRLVGRLGGEITCQSAPGQGARFRVDLPVDPCAPETTELERTAQDGAPAPDLPASPVSAEAEAGHSRAGKGGAGNSETGNSEAGQVTPRQLLLVDDNEINRDLLGVMLRRMGHEVTLAPGGAEAIALAAAHRYDAILMDISMPGISGVQATRTIQSAADSRNRATPIIAVTAHALPHEREEFRAAGMTGFLQKPVDRAALAQSIADLPLPANAAARAAPSERPDLAPDPIHAPAPAPGAPPQPPVLNDTQVADLTELLGAAQLRERLARLEGQIDHDLPALQQATATEDIQARAHALAGICGMFGIERLHIRLKAIETACKAGDRGAAQAQMPPLAAAWEEARAAWHARLG